MGRFVFMTNKFLNGLWRRDFGGNFGGVFLGRFGSGGVEWAEARKMMRVIFVGSVGVGDLERSAVEFWEADLV